MNFISLGFVLFTLAAYVIYWSLPGFTLRKAFLVVASYGFYAVWDWRFCGLMAFVTVNAWLAGRLLPHTTGARRRTVLGLSIGVDLIVLAFFKYYNFFIEGFAAGLEALGLNANLPLLQIILPIGISFYTFHAISYVMDVHRGKVRSEPSLLNVALYIAFFPQLVAGPIVRSSFFMPQLRQPRRFLKTQQISAVRLIVRGLIYKAVIADMLAKFVDPAYANVSTALRSDLLTATIAFYGQIYFDFAGYTLLALGTSRLFGYRLPRNFNYPYAAASLSDFWRRWHMSLSFWLRDYLYISLGGNRGARWMVYRNLMLTMVLGGLWHGASGTFLFWGFWHGLGLCLHKGWTELSPTHPLRRMAALAGTTGAVILTQLWVLIGWIFFRATSFSDAIVVLQKITTLSAWVHSFDTVGFVVMVIVIDHLLGLRSRSFGRWLHCGGRSRALSPVLFWLGAGILLAFALMLMQLSSGSFIYFQF